MGRICWRRVLLGGVVAGVIVDLSEFILNGLILMKDWEAAMQAIGKPSLTGGAQLVSLNVWGLLIGLFAVWLYAAIRPRYGAGPRTAVYAGAAVWFLGYALTTMSALISDLFPARLLLIAVAWGLPEAILATLAGAWLYREKAAAVPMM